MDKLSAIDPSPDAVLDSWSQLEESMESLLDVVTGLQSYSKVRLFVLCVSRVFENSMVSSCHVSLPFKALDIVHVNVLETLLW